MHQSMSGSAVHVFTLMPLLVCSGRPASNKNHAPEPHSVFHHASRRACLAYFAFIASYDARERSVSSGSLLTSGASFTALTYGATASCVVLSELSRSHLTMNAAGASGFVVTTMFIIWVTVRSTLCSSQYLFASS